MQSIGEHALDQFRFLIKCRAENLRCALVTIVNVIGTASRRIGAHVAVCEDGRYAGSVSSGCIDASVAAAAVSTIEEGRSQRVQFGEGSPFVDVKLPCGGGVDLWITPNPDDTALARVVEDLEARRPSAIRIGDGGLALQDEGAQSQTDWADDEFFVSYLPKLKLEIAGRGPELIQLSSVAIAAGFDVCAYSPDKDDLAVCESHGAVGYHLSSLDTPPGIKGDPWTAVVLLFHEHEWEPAILKSALQSDSFYIGALGSRRTQEARLEALRQQGVAGADLARISGPIGLVPSMRNASMLAISTLAEIIAAFQQKTT